METSEFKSKTTVIISWLPSPSAVILEPKKITSVTVSIVSPSICHEVMGLGPNAPGIKILTVLGLHSGMRVQ